MANTYPVGTRLNINNMTVRVTGEDVRDNEVSVLFDVEEVRITQAQWDAVSDADRGKLAGIVRIVEDQDVVNP